MNHIASKGPMRRVGSKVARLVAFPVCLMLLGGAASPATLENARRQLARGEYDQAVESARVLIEADPGDADAYSILGAAETHLWNLDDAAKHLEKAARLDPDAPDLHYRLGYLAAARAVKSADKYKYDKATRLILEAADEFEIELARSPGHLSALAGRAQALGTAGEVDASIVAHEAWIAAALDDARPYQSLIRLHLMREQTIEAAAVVERLPGGDPAAITDSLYTVARHLYAMEETDLARSVFERLGMIGVEPWRIHGLTALDSLSRADRLAASRALLRFFRSGAPDAEATGMFRTYRSLSSKSPMVEWENDGVGPDGIRPPQVAQPTMRRITLMGGAVVMVAVVGTDGSIAEIFPVYGSGLDHESTRSIAMKTAARWRFEPATFQGQPVEYPVPLVFSGGALTFTGWNRLELSPGAEWLWWQMFSVSRDVSGRRTLLP